MATYIDQTGKKINLQGTPSRIVSLVPSQTELLFDLGLAKEVVAITKFCVHPQQWFRTKTSIGGTKSINTDQVAALEPGLIIANKEENSKAQVEALSATCPVWISDISNLREAMQMITSIGEITGTLAKAQTIVEEIKTRFAQLVPAPAPLRTAYLIWQNPYMTVGGDTFIHSMLSHCGFENIFTNLQRYPAITIEEIKNHHCQLLLLSSEPFPFKQKHIEELQQQLPSTKIILADGEMFSWYGSRLLLAPDYFETLIKNLLI